MTEPAQRHGGIAIGADRSEVEARLRDGQFFWLDLERPGETEFALLRETFGFHELAVEDSEDFGQRPKLDTYDDFVFLVVYGATDDEDLLVEVHCFYSERYLVTVHVDDCAELERLQRRLREASGPVEPPMVLHQVVDSLVDSFFPVLRTLDDRIDDLEDAIFVHPSSEQPKEIFAIKRQLVMLRKAVGPQRDLFATASDDLSRLPGMTEESERSFRDVYDHLIRLGDMIDTYRDLLSTAMDAHLSNVSNRLNEVTKQLTLIATIFLPLSFLTGFFGQNFRWLVDHVGGGAEFAVFGIGLELVVLLLLLVYFRRRHWV